MTDSQCSNCGKASANLSRTWCRNCYQRWWKAGRPDSGPPAPRLARPAKPIEPCVDCGTRPEKQPRRNRCESCYRARLRKQKLEGTFQPKAGRPSRPLIDRIMDRVAEDANGCWIFTGPLTGGYGHSVDESGQPVRAHRATYAEFVGPIPDGLHLDHLCSVRNCVNPQHLEPVTQAVNNQRAYDRAAVDGRRAKRPLKPHCSHGHEYTPETTYVNPDGSRSCRLCSRATDARRRAAKKLAN